MLTVWRPHRELRRLGRELWLDLLAQSVSQNARPDRQHGDQPPVSQYDVGPIEQPDFV